ncbi:hypothetical protein PV04_08815 [Phialophora macrospora]|uniref:Uncharacterized protein n=1 Tax=Phialophora macrospora TaxID=1851006 RepID=A0A0D2F785_9EURO|nr:hypothetical protein PV04_08815 [Phialophora macrospora]
MAEVRQYVQIKPLAPGAAVKSAARSLPHLSVELFWIDEAVSQHRRKLINTHAQKRSRQLKRLKDGPNSTAAHPKHEELGTLIQFLSPGDSSGVVSPNVGAKPRLRREHFGSTELWAAQLQRPAEAGCSSRLFSQFPEPLIAGLDDLVTPSASMTDQAGDLLKFAETLALNTGTISAHWGKSCVASLGLTWSLSCPVRLLNLLERTSAYIDTEQGVGVSPRTIFWRHAVIRRLAALISDPNTRYGDEVLYGIMSLLHGYLHRWDARKGEITTEGAHSAGLRDFITHHGGWNKINLPTQLEQFVRMSMIMTSRRLASYLDNIRSENIGHKVLVEWRDEVQRVVSQLRDMAVWSLQVSQHSRMDHKPLAKDIQQLLAAETSGICDHCHQMFILVWLALVKWRARMDILRYEDVIVTLNHRYRSLTHTGLQDVSWAIISSRSGDEECHWGSVEILKVLHRTTVYTQKQICRWLFDVTCGTVTEGTVSVGSDMFDRIWEDAVEELPAIPSRHI